MSEQADQDFLAWKNFHDTQLKAIGLPEPLHRKLWKKLKFDDYDFSEHVKVVLNEDTETVEVVCTKELDAESDVFLVDHAWTFRFEDAYNTLNTNPALCDRLIKLTDTGLDKLEFPNQQQPEESK
jgi:tubulin--tyrosine ligase-like protein 12